MHARVQVCVCLRARKLARKHAPRTPHPALTSVIAQLLNFTEWLHMSLFSQSLASLPTCKDGKE